jgi:hypothetical protein
MLPFLLRRAFSSIVVMFCVVSLAFVLIRSIKGGPFEKEKTPAHIIAAMEAKYQLNGSLWQQYTAYLNRLAHLDLGPSAKYRDWQVAEILAQRAGHGVLSVGAAQGVEERRQRHRVPVGRPRIAHPAIPWLEARRTVEPRLARNPRQHRRARLRCLGHPLVAPARRQR